MEESGRSITARHVDFLLGVGLCLFTFLFFANAWVCDDAYITFRTIDNFVNGYGLRWNVFERVQAYTHPLWMFLCLVPYYFTKEVFYTVLALSYVVSLSTFLVHRKSLPHSDRWKTAVLILVLMTSKTFMDFTSSGLENCLSAAWAVLFIAVAFRAAPQRTRFAFLSALLIASAAYVTRQDTVLIYIPACVMLAVEHRRHGGRLWRHVALGLSPALIWTTFAVVYYGFPFPNTAYAKALVAGLSTSDRIRQGVAYLFVTGLWDPFAIVILLVFGYVTIRSRSARSVAMGCGVACYLLYVVAVAASSAPIGLRFLSVPLAVAAVATVAAVDAMESAVLGALAIVFLSLNPLSPIRTIGCSWSSREQAWGSSAILDLRFHACQGGAALANFRRTESLPSHLWFKIGLQFRQSPERVHVPAPSNIGMGYFGYAAGPSKIIVDALGVTDPLIARLPASIGPQWIPGHIPRPVPAGYVESLQANANVIVDPSLHEFYDSLSRITQGPIFSAQRWQDILALNVGRRDYLIRTYEARRRRSAPSPPDEGHPK